MKFAVDLNQCENHGQCTLVAPDLFALDEEGSLSFRSRADDEYVSTGLSPEHEAEASVAAGTCPMQAIRLIG